MKKETAFLRKGGEFETVTQQSGLFDIQVRLYPKKTKRGVVFVLRSFDTPQAQLAPAEMILEQKN